MSAQVRLGPAWITRVLRLRNGAVGRRLAERTQRVAAIAAREAPGRMGQDVSWKVIDTPRGLQGVITCDHPAVLYVPNGTRPHIIRPRRKTGVLRFVVDGEVVYARVVRHPGTKPNDFLGRALREGR
ncbi:hypothetical protein VSR01_16165 [Actinacidiphila sp. DG2A-62]|uniref:hypothetical protein n=1 Tax=Actinacidiphila sp. DG2A-62 TaxID=3108821 RepID=UPI002DBC7F8F|nr:hypothetical protein [Actinacidiphila sp. DG2A-62]MEC3994980.1 hypothetical protein [Actinacidiphila sp. DG2A-62]